MSLSKHSRPSPAIVVAAVAVVVALGGTAVAAPDFVNEKITKSKVKKIAKRQAKKQIKKKAPRLSVGHASTATNADNATNATTATNAQKAANGAAGYGEFNAVGGARPGALNMNNLTISAEAPYIYCEDQAFKAVVATGGITSGGQYSTVSAISRQQLADVGATPATLGCPPRTEWVYVTFDRSRTVSPSNFQAVGH